MLSSFSPELANSIIQFFENASKEVNMFIDSLQNAALAVETLNEYWILITGQDFADSKLWKSLGNIWDAITPFEIFLSLIQAMGASLATLFAPLITLLAELAAGVPVKQAMQDAGRAAGEAFVSGVSISLETLLKDEDGAIATKIKEWWKEQTGVDLDTFQSPKIPKDRLGEGTPTGPSVSGELEDDQQDLQDALEKMNDAILEAQLKLAQDMEDAAIDLGRKLVDIDTEYARKRADAQRAYASQVADINRDYANRIADINAQAQQSRNEARAQELEDELKFQNEMQELKENFLMDLEDALHARDARQVLKLIKQYNLDKTQAERKHELDVDSAKRDEALRQQKFQADRRAAERDRRARLAEAQIKYQEKLAELKRDEDAERVAAQLAYQRKMEDLQRAMHDRLEVIAAGLVSEYNLTRQGLEALLRLYGRYYSNLIQMANAMNRALAGQGTLVGGSTSGGSSGGIGGGRRYAEGGMAISNKTT